MSVLLIEHCVICIKQFLLLPEASQQLQGRLSIMALAEPLCDCPTSSDENVWVLQQRQQCRPLLALGDTRAEKVQAPRVPNIPAGSLLMCPNPD